MSEMHVSCSSWLCIGLHSRVNAAHFKCFAGAQRSLQSTTLGRRGAWFLDADLRFVAGDQQSSRSLDRSTPRHARGSTAIVRLSWGSRYGRLLGAPFPRHGGGRPPWHRRVVNRVTRIQFSETDLARVRALASVALPEVRSRGRSWSWCAGEEFNLALRAGPVGAASESEGRTSW